MPPIVSILLVLTLAILAVVMFTSRTAKPVTEKQMHKYGNIIRILIVVMMVSAAVKMCTG
ncbi:hypothetical protein [Reinekea thalattae]|uniref:Uncharacterized protein n=1 Tax=Reinekea thalattae TaxID=2593301 RepID=A0A5C8Z3M6_9GAMM|nr:hypothetical protein [Reinekea thalattae]TXR51506.1 hypothetical protein FME95_13375 [Reinekea thalattae]